LPDDNKTQWWGNGVGPDPDAWFNAELQKDKREGALSLYKKYSFNKSYKHIGFELHCLQDEDVPAHISRCCHGTLGVYLIDDLEWKALSSFGYAISLTPWTYTLPHSKGTDTFSYWLPDDEDDDNGDEMAGVGDEVDAMGKLIVDGPDKWGIPKTDWGTYGQPKFSIDKKTKMKVLSEMLPGKNEGVDYYGGISGNEIIIHEQLYKSYTKTLARVKLRSTQLPPLVPDDGKHGQPSISAKIFGPNKPVDISFVAMENRQKTVFILIRSGAAAIKDTVGKVWDGGLSATYDLAADSNASSLPWKDTITVSWKGDYGTGDLDDGQHTVTIKIKDQDDNDSEERSRTVKYDKTKPTGTITVSVLP
jgi:hypothetical protein